MGEVTLSGPAIIAITALLSALTVAIRYLHKLLMDAKEAQYRDAIAIRDAQIAENKQEADALRGIAKETMAAGEAAMNAVRAHRGQPPLKPVPAVIPEHASPVTPAQESAAELATLRARAAVILMELGIPPRTRFDQDVKADDAPKENTETVMDEAKDKMRFASEVIIDGAKEKLKEAGGVNP